MSAPSGPSAPGLLDRTTSRWPDRLASLMSVRLIVWVLLAFVVHQGIYSDAFKISDWMDEHQFIGWEETDRRTLLEYHQLPTWNPYWCGGTVGLAAPEDGFLGPDFLLRLVFGVLTGRRLAILLLVVMGLEGMYRLARRFDASVMGAGFAAVVFATCDRFDGFIHDGWINFLGFELVPWVVLGAVNGIRSTGWRLLGGALFAWIVFSAGTYPTPFTVLVVGYVTLALSLHALLTQPGRAWLAPWKSALAVGLVGFVLAFGKLVPTVAFLRQFPRVFTPIETHSAGELFGVFQTHYLAVVVLALIAVATADVAAGIFLGGGTLFFLLAMGDVGDWSPFHLLKELPLFSQLRFPERYMVIVLFFFALAAARGITRVEDALPALVSRAWRAARRGRGGEAPKELRWLAVGLAAGLAWLVVSAQAGKVLEAVKIRPGLMYKEDAPQAYAQPFKQSRGNRRDAHVFAFANMGSLYCVAGNPLPESAKLRGDLASEEYPLDPATATVQRVSWSPNEIVLDVDARAATTVVVNQNWAAEWRASSGTVRSADGLLAVDLPAGKTQLTLSYRDRALVACLAVSGLAFLALVFWFLRRALRWLAAENKRWLTLPTWPDEVPELLADAGLPPEPSADD